MKFLVLASGTEPGTAADFGLVEAGHQVVRCHDEGAPAFPCRGMVSGDCPLDVGDVDAALFVGGGDGDSVTDDGAGEDGARCALRRHVPLVVAGLSDGSSLKPWASAVLQRTDDVTATLEIAAQAPSAQHGSVAAGAFAGVLEAHGLDGEVAEAVVFRMGGSLHVELRPTGPVDESILEIAAVRVAGALRAFDPYPRVIDVVSISG